MHQGRLLSSLQMILRPHLLLFVSLVRLSVSTYLLRSLLILFLLSSKNGNQARNRYEIGVNEYIIDKMTVTVYRHQNNGTTVYYLEPTEYFNPLTTKRKNTLQESKSEVKTNELFVPKK